MPFAWGQLEPRSFGQVSKFDIPINEWLGLKFGEGLASGLGRAVWDMGEDFAWDNGPKVDPKILNASFSIPGYLQFLEPETIGKAYLVFERKKEELQRMAYLDSASHAAFSGKGIAGFVAGMAGGFANPVDFSTAFIPFVGSSTKAAPIARMGRGLLGSQKYGPIGQAIRATRVGLAEGLVTQEALGLGRGASVVGSMLDGVLSQAAVEAPIAFEKSRNQSEYGFKDSMFNILAGGLFAGGLNIAGQSIEIAYNKAIRSAINLHSKMDPETKDLLVRNQEDAFVRGTAPDTDKIIRIDESAIRARIEAEKFDAEAARQLALKEGNIEISMPGQKKTAGPNEILYLLQTEATRLSNKPAGKIAQRMLDRFLGGEKSYDLLSQMAEFVDRQYDPTAVNPQEDFFIERIFGGERAKQIGVVNAKLKEIRGELFEIERVRSELMQQMRANEGNELMLRQLRSNDHNLTLRQNELIAALEKVGDEFVGPSPLKPKEIRDHQASNIEAIKQQYQIDAQKIETERNKRIAEFIEKKRQEWKDGLEGRVSEAKRQEIIRQQEEGRQLTPEDAARYEARAAVDRADLEIIKKDTENLDAEFRDIANQTPGTSALSEAEIAAIRSELEAIDSEVYQSQANAVIGAAPCAGRIR